MTNDKDKQREYSRRWRLKNREKDRAHSQKWRAKNRDRIREYEKRTATAADAVRHQARVHRRRARLQSTEGSWTAAEFIALGNKCVYCGAEGQMSPDHDIPVSRGGSNWISNIVPACLPCNLSKNALTGDEFREKKQAGAA